MRAGIISLLFIGIGFFILFQALGDAGCNMKERWETAEIVDTNFTPGSAGTGITSGGKVVFVSTLDTYSIRVKYQDGSREWREVTKSFYDNCDKGEKVEVGRRFFGVRKLTKGNN